MSVIHSRYGVNRTGVFRSVFDLMLQEIKRAGGIDAVLPFEEDCTAGVRRFSAPWNSGAMEDYHRTVSSDSRILMIDLYSDGTTLSSSGSQSANNMRVRFANLKGRTDVWHEVGIVPTPKFDNLGKRPSDDAVKREKVQLWHRFTFLLLKEALLKYHVGTIIDGVNVFPRLGMNVTDQVQERPTCGLKGLDSFCDCTHCTMPSRMKKRKLASDSQRKQIQKENEQQSATSFLSRDERVDVEDHSESAAIGDNVLAIQTSPISYPGRDVYRTVTNQLLFAIKIRSRQKDVSSGRLLKEAKEYLSSVSALDFPPVLAAFAGAGSNPFRLYASVAFDKLHVVEHGILRQVTDDAFRVFDSAPQYNGMTKGQIVSIANQRIQDLPRSCQLPKIEPFRKREEERHAGVTGKVRRELAPFFVVLYDGNSTKCRSR